MSDEDAPDHTVSLWTESPRVRYWSLTLEEEFQGRQRRTPASSRLRMRLSVGQADRTEVSTAGSNAHSHAPVFGNVPRTWGMADRRDAPELDFASALFKVG